MGNLQSFLSNLPVETLHAPSGARQRLQRQHRLDRYQSALAEACGLYRSAGRPVQMFREGSQDCEQSRFLKLDEGFQNQILENLISHNRVLEASLTEESKLLRRPNHSLAWSALKILGLTPPPDAFAHLLDTHIIEIYNTSFTQMFRSLNFFSFVSYSLDELMTYHFSDLYMRTGTTTEEMMAMTERVRSDLQPTTYVRPFTRCTVKEIFGQRGICADSDSVIGASLFDSTGKFGGYLSAIEIYTSWTEPRLAVQ